MLSSIQITLQKPTPSNRFHKNQPSSNWEPMTPTKPQRVVSLIFDLITSSTGRLDTVALEDGFYGLARTAIIIIIKMMVMMMFLFTMQLTKFVLPPPPPLSLHLSLSGLIPCFIAAMNIALCSQQRSVSVLLSNFS